MLFKNIKIQYFATRKKKGSMENTADVHAHTHFVSHTTTINIKDYGAYTHTYAYFIYKYNI